MHLLGSGCGTVGRAVASNTRDLWFESQHRQKFICHLCHWCRKDKNKEKEAGIGPDEDAPLLRDLIKDTLPLIEDEKKPWCQVDSNSAPPD